MSQLPEANEIEGALTKLVADLDVMDRDPGMDMEATIRRCRVCGCTEGHACIDPEHGPCWWIEKDLCSHCGEAELVAAEYDRLQAQLRDDAASIDPGEYAARMVAWADKARVALERASTSAWDIFEP